MQRIARSAAFLAVAVLLTVTVAALALPLPRIPIRPPVPRPPVIKPPPTIKPSPGIKPGPNVRPGQGPGPRFPILVDEFVLPPSTPEVVRSRVVTSIVKNQPAEALSLLQREGNLLPAVERGRLTRLALDRLGQMAEGSPDVWGTLHEVRQARRLAGDIGPQGLQKLSGMEAHLEYRVQAEGLKSVIRHARREQWAQANEQASGWLHQEQNVVRVEPAAPRGPLTGDVRKAMGDVEQLTRQMKSLDSLEAALKANPGAPAETAAAFRKVDLNALPVGLKDSVSGLRGLAELRAEAVGLWRQPPDIAQLRQAVNHFERGLTTAGHPEAMLARQLQQDLAVKALLEGHPQAARQLLPSEGPAQHAGNLLRDLKAMALGKGEVRTWPAEQALKMEQGFGIDVPGGPPRGLRPLIPEGEAAGWRPPVRDSVRAELPPLERATQLEKSLAEQAKAALPRERSAAEGRTTRSFHHIHHLHLTLEQDEDEQRERFIEIERALRRELAPAERARVRHLQHQGKEPAAIVGMFRADPDECLETLAQVEGILGRQLAEAEKDQVCRMGREGKTVAMIVASLRLNDTKERVPQLQEVPADAGAPPSR